MRYSEDPNTLLTNFDTCTDVDEIALTPGLPGGMVVFEGSVIDGVNDIFYFAVRTIDSNDAEVTKHWNTIYKMIIGFFIEKKIDLDF